MRAYRFRTWFENKMYKVSSFIQQDETTIKFCGYTEDLKLADDFSDNIMQDTGVKDVNGKSVFEGDIVSEHYQRIEGPNYDPISLGFIDNDFEIDATLIGEVVIWPSAGSRMFWWDKFNPLALFGDKRSKTHWVMFMKTEA